MALSMLTKSSVFGFAVAGDSAARRADAPGTSRRPDPSGSSRPARAGLPSPLSFLSALPRPRAAFRGGLGSSLAVAPVLFGLAALAPSGPAQAQTEVFSDTMTVGTSSPIPNRRGFSRQANIPYGSMGSGDFTYKGSNFAVDRLAFHSANGFTVKLTLVQGQSAPAYAAAYSLCLDGTKAAGWTGDFTPEYIEAVVLGTTSSVSWTNGQKVAVKMVEGTSCPAVTVRNLQVVDVGGYHITVEWDPPAFGTVAAYCGRAVKAAFAGDRLGFFSFPGSATRVEFSPLAANTTYQIEVAALGTATEDCSAAAAATVSDTTRPLVSLSASPNPVEEGSDVWITATADVAPANDVAFRVDVTAITSEIRGVPNVDRDDHGTLSNITIRGGQTSGSARISTIRDGDGDDETFSVEFGCTPLPGGAPDRTCDLPSPYVRGVSSVTVTISEDPPPADDDDGSDDDGIGGAPGGAPGGGAPGGGAPGGDGDGDTGGGPPAEAPQPVASFSVSAACADFGAPGGGEVCRARAGNAVEFTDTSSGGVVARRWNFGDGSTTTGEAPSHSWSSPGFYTVTLVASGTEKESTARRTFLVEAANPVGSCSASAETRCLGNGQFSIEVEWRRGVGNASGASHAVPAATDDPAGQESGVSYVVPVGTDDSAIYCFFDPDNWEVLVKVLDGCAVNGHMWVYLAAATSMGYEIKVTDTVSGVEKIYLNEPGRVASAFTDSSAFVCSDPAGLSASASAASSGAAGSNFVRGVPPER